MRDLSLHLMDIIQNSIAAKSSSICITFKADKNKDMLIMSVADNGVGMDEELVKKVVDPFFTTRDTRKVGLGIPLLAASCERSSGNLTIESAKGVGTTLTATFRLSHIDRPPLGDVVETVIAVISSNPEIEMNLKFISEKGVFDFSTTDVKQKIGDIPINHYEILTWIKEYLSEGVMITFGGVLNEIYS